MGGVVMESNNKNDIGTNENRYVSYFGSKSNNTKSDAEKNNFDLVVVAGVPHALPIEKLNAKSIAITDGPRLVEPLKKLGYDWVVTELDAHAKTLGTDKIVSSDFGTVLREKF